MLNEVKLIGRLGGDVKTGETKGGVAYGQFSVATTENYTDRNGDRQSVTTWHNCAVFGKLADIAAQVSAKGSQVFVQGALRTRKYTGKDNVERTYTDIRVDTFRSLETKEQTQARRAGAGEGNVASEEDLPIPE